MQKSCMHERSAAPRRATEWRALFALSWSLDLILVHDRDDAAIELLAVFPGLCLQMVDELSVRLQVSAIVSWMNSTQ
jgi:hypothetical protein